MAKFSGLVGYTSKEETTPGVWSTVENPRKMKGDIIRQGANYSSSNHISDDVSLNHRVSLIGDAYAFDRYYDIKWVEIDSIKWKVESIEIQRPRIIVSIGGVWNG